MQTIREMGLAARRAATELATVSGELRSKALEAMSAGLASIETELKSANAADVSDAREAGMAEPLVKRLIINDKVFAYMRNRLSEVAALPDPVNQVLEGFTRPNGLRVQRISVPIGVIGVIYESRPNVTTDAASVCLKSGNAVILRGGSESLRTNLVLADAMSTAAEASGLPAAAIQIVRTADRAAVGELLKMDDCIDVLIPRGGKALIERVAAESRVPVIKHYDGICHQYLATDAPVDTAVAIVVNSKCQRVEVCNALETLLVDSSCAARLLPNLAFALYAAGVTIRACKRTREHLSASPEPSELVDALRAAGATVRESSHDYRSSVEPATEDDWNTEYLDAILSVKVVDGIDDAIAHINTYGSGHTDGIVTETMALANQFVAGVDSGSVLVNASTRLSGGGDYGLGAVVGISTDKLHARGPVGPRELTSYKWVAYGDGHLRG